LCNVTSSGVLEPSSVISSPISGETLTSLTWGLPPPAYASSCWVSSAARIAATRMLVSALWLPAGSRSARSALPRIATSRLLKSCASPPASTPRLSARWASTIRRSSERPAVTSIAVPIVPISVPSDDRRGPSRAVNVLPPHSMSYDTTSPPSAWRWYAITGWSGSSVRRYSNSVIPTVRFASEPSSSRTAPPDDVIRRSRSVVHSTAGIWPISRPSVVAACSSSSRPLTTCSRA
jgi:hypothetical protein